MLSCGMEIKVEFLSFPPQLGSTQQFYKSDTRVSNETSRKWTPHKLATVPEKFGLNDMVNFPKELWGRDWNRIKFS